MRTKFSIIILLLLFTHALACQEYEWTQVNPWRYQDLIVVNFFDNEIYFFDRCANELLFLDEELEVDSSVYFGDDYNISRFIKFDEFGFAIASTESFQSFIFRYDNNFNVLEQDLVQSTISGFYRLTDKLLVISLVGDHSVYSFIEPSSGEELFSYTCDSGLLLLDICVGDGLSYLNLGEKVIVVDESIGIVDSFEVDFKINDIEIYSDNSLSVAGSSKFIYILSQDNYSKIDSIETLGLGIPILPDEIFSHRYIDQRIYVSSNFKMEYSDNNGDSWTDVDVEKDKFIRNNVQFDFSNDKYLFWRSVFGIEGFNLQDESLRSFNALPLDKLNSISILNDSTIIAINGSLNSNYREVWKSIDFGISWYKVTEWNLGGNFVFGFSYDVNIEAAAIHYSPVDSFVYYSDYLGTNWVRVSDDKMAAVQDAFISNSGDFGLVTEEYIFVREEGKDEWSEKYSFEPNNYLLSVKDNLTNNWIVGFDKIDSSCIIFQYDDNTGLSEPIFINGINVRYLNYDSNDEGDLFVSTGEELVKIDAESLEIEYDCAELSNVEVLNYHNESSIVLIMNDSLYFTETGCEKSELKLLKSNSKIGDYYFSGGRDFFNSEGNWLNIDGTVMWVYREPLDDGYIPTDIQDTKSYVNNQWIHAFPNPTDGMVYFQGGLEVDSYRVYSIDGILLKSEKSSEVNVSELVTGVYFIVLNTTEGIRFAKVVKS